MIDVVIGVISFLSFLLISSQISGKQCIRPSLTSSGESRQEESRDQEVAFYIMEYWVSYRQFDRISLKLCIDVKLIQHTCNILSRWRLKLWKLMGITFGIWDLVQQGMKLAFDRERVGRSKWWRCDVRATTSLPLSQWCGRNPQCGQCLCRDSGDVAHPSLFTRTNVIFKIGTTIEVSSSSVT